MFKKGSLKANVASMFSANLLYALSSWAQLSLVAKFLDGVVLGEYTLALAIVTPLYLFSNMQLRSLIITDNNNNFSFVNYYSFRVFSNVLLLLIVFFISVFYYYSFFYVIVLVSLLKIVESNSDIINSHFQKKEEMHYVTRSVGIRSILAFIGMFLGVFVFRNLPVGLGLSLCFTGLSYLLYDKKIAKNKGFFEDFKFDFRKNREIFKIALPLGLVIFIISLNSNVSKFMIERFLGTEMQGIYSSISYLIILGTFVCNAVGQSFSPRLSKYFSDKNFSQFINLQKKFIIFNVVVGLLAIVFSVFFGELMLRILFNGKIAEYSNLLTLVMIGGLGNYLATALGYTLTSMREFRIQPRINLIIFIIKFLLLLFFVRKFGIYGAVYTSIITSFLQNIIVFYYIQNRLKQLKA